MRRSSSANTPSAVKRKKKRKKLHHIGFAVYEVPPHMTRLTPIYVAEHVRKREGVPQRTLTGMAARFFYPSSERL